MRPFQREEHVFRSPDFQEVVKDAIRFFNGTPVYHLPLPKGVQADGAYPPSRFKGAGVYGIYYTGAHDVYQAISQRNRLAYNLPIYVGKAVPEGWRQGRDTADAAEDTLSLHKRMREHAKSIVRTPDLDLLDFRCRFMILEHVESDLIGTVEAALIRLYRPLWNSEIDGFGNHDPGNGRYEGAKPEWDVLHPGRSWADKCKGVPTPLTNIKDRITEYGYRLEKEKPSE